MSVTPGLSGVSQTVGASEELFFQSPAGNVHVTTLCVKVDALSPTYARVRIPELHGTTANTGLVIAPGEKEYFRVEDGALLTAYVSGNTAIIHWGGTARTKGF
jgi:hypothetical protein